MKINKAKPGQGFNNFRLLAMYCAMHNTHGLGNCICIVNIEPDLAQELLPPLLPGYSPAIFLRAAKLLTITVGLAQAPHP